MDHNVEHMSVGQVQHLIERAYRESGELQFVRELYKNAVEAKATRIEFGPEWESVERCGLYRLMVADNGQGMTPDQIEGFLNTFGGGGKPIGDAHENYGIGAKTSTLPWNQHGLVVISWTSEDPEGSMVWLCRDPKTGEYGARKFETEGGNVEVVVAPFNDEKNGVDWRQVKPDWIGKHGTVVVCLGNTGQEDTFATKDASAEEFSIKGMSSYLYRRIWQIPDGVEVYVQEMRSGKKADWPRNYREATSSNSETSDDVDRRWNRRRIRGAKYYVEYPSNSKGELDSTGELTLPDGTVAEWYLWSGRRPSVDSYAHDKGYIAALYNNELYDVKKHHASFRSFGITKAEVRERLTVIMRPPKLSNDSTYGVYPDSARNTLKVKGTKMAGESLPWEEWGEYFANHPPVEVSDAIKAAIPSSQGTLKDDKWRERLSERFSKRWKRTLLVLNLNGDTKASPTGESGPKPRPKPKPPRPKPPKPEPNDNENGSEGSEPGPKSASQITGKGGVPNYRWVDEDDIEEGGGSSLVQAE